MSRHNGICATMSRMEFCISVLQIYTEHVTQKGFIMVIRLIMTPLQSRGMQMVSHLFIL